VVNGQGIESAGAHHKPAARSAAAGRTDGGFNGWCYRPAQRLDGDRDLWPPTNARLALLLTIVAVLGLHRPGRVRHSTPTIGAASADQPVFESRDPADPALRWSPRG